MKLLALVLLFSTFSSLTLMEVVKDLNEWKSSDKCGDFFIQNPENQNIRITPTFFSNNTYKMICQRWNNKYRFATLYDTERRIPLYSAYTFYREGGTRQDRPTWKIEPQLDNIKVPNKDVKEMVNSREAEAVGNITHQAADSDYKNTIYTRGHVFPHLFAADDDQSNSTFTLTNTAPQLQSHNSNWSTKVEQPMRDNIKNICTLDQNHLAYIVTGVIPGNNSMTIIQDKGYQKNINVPSHFWSAFCCLSKTNNGKLIVRAYIFELKDFTLRCPTFKTLDDRLSKLYREMFSVFPGLPDEKVEHAFRGGECKVGRNKQKYFPRAISEGETKDVTKNTVLV